MKVKPYFYRILIIALLHVITGCDNGTIYKRLAAIDKLVDREMKDTTAYKSIMEIDTCEIKNERDRAYYNLLKTQILYKLFMPIESDSMINISIQYYEKTNDIEKLARSYYYKGATIYELGRINEAVVCIKQAEHIADKIKDNILYHKIYQSMTLINGNAKEYEKGIEYCKKQYNVSKDVGNNNWIAGSLIDMTTMYALMGHIDSAKLCTVECLTVIDKVPKDEQSFFYTTLGQIYMNEEPELAKSYLLKALKYNNLPKSYKFLADIYMMEGDSIKAMELWQKALKTVNIKLKIDALTAIQTQQENNGDYMMATKTAKWIMALKDSARKKREDEKVLKLQEQYDAEIKEKETENKYITIIYILLSAASILIMLTLYNKYRIYKTRQEVKKSINTIEKYSDRIKELEGTGKASMKEATELKHKIILLREKQADMLNKGKILYDHISKDNPVVKWNRTDYIHYLEYYRTLNPDFIRSLESDYDTLTPRQKFIMTLYDMGKTDCDIARIMAINVGSVRSIKTRIKQRKL